MCGGETDDLPQKTLIDLSEYISGKNAELVWTIRIIEVLDNILDDLVVNFKMGGKIIMIRPMFLRPEVKETGIVLVIGLSEQMEQSLITLYAIAQAEQASILFDTAILANAQKHNSINRALNADIEFALGKRRVA